MFAALRMPPDSPTARSLTDADVEAIADAVALRMRQHERAPRRATPSARARISPAVAAARAEAASGPIDDVTRARVLRAMRRAGA